MPGTCQALLFDFDGLIVDSEVATYQSWRDVYSEYGVDLSLEDWLPAVGTGSSTQGAFDAVAHLEQLVETSVDRDDVIARRTRRKAELYTKAPLLPGVAELLAEARRRGLRTAIVTRNREERVIAQCALVGLEHDWDLLVCAEEDPLLDKGVLYRRALAALKVAPEDAVAFEDSESGVCAASAAGIACVAVPSEITRSAEFAEADAIVPTLAGVSLDEILRAAGKLP